MNAADKYLIIVAFHYDLRIMLMFDAGLTLLIAIKGLSKSCAVEKLRMNSTML